MNFGACLMLMIDTNVVIDFWRNPSEEMEQEFCANDCCICGVQSAELIYGAVSEKDAKAIEEALSVFAFVQVEDTDWIRLGRFLYRLRKRGITVPFPDALIACVAVRHNMPVWTHDKHFHLIQSAIPELKLYKMS